MLPENFLTLQLKSEHPLERLHLETMLDVRVFCSSHNSPGNLWMQYMNE